MPAILTTEQILALASDAGSAKDGKALANTRKWVTLGCSERAAWGECQGSGKLPYQTQVDLAEISFKCSCPSHKFPCKHSLGLFLLLSEQSSAFSQSEPPEWVKQWLEGRDKRAAQKKTRVEKPNTVSDMAAQAKRAEQREAKVAAGLHELELWLRDLTRQGLATAQGKPYSFWDKPALRLEDAQAKSAARLIRDLAAIPTSGEGWHNRLLEQLGRIYLLTEGFKRLDKLPAGTQADIRTLVGWTQNTDEILATNQQNTIRDCWQVLGQHLETDEKFKTRRTWLWGQQSQKPALILHFAAPGQPLDTSLIHGSQFEAELAFYPGGYPLRALVKERFERATLLQSFPGYLDISSAFRAYSEALTRNPWLEQFPIALQEVIPVLENNKLIFCDKEKRYLPSSPQFQRNWQLLALSGGKSIAVFGEWDGDYLLPLSGWAENRFVAF